MENELIVCAAAFFRCRGKSVVTETEFMMYVSMDLHWMPYSDAKRLMNRLIAEKILERDGEYIKPAFDVSEINVPVAYRPPKNITDMKAPKKPGAKEDGDVFPSLIAEAAKLGMEKRDFISESNGLQKKLNIDFAAAGLIVLRDHGMDTGNLAERVYSSVIAK